MSKVIAPKANANKSISASQVDRECQNMFPSLPPLLHGPPEVHFRNGITRASRLAATHDVDFDAENAFFVADLSQVYKQHLRWNKYLPEIKPFYGRFCWFSYLKNDAKTVFIAIKCHPDPYVLRLLAALGTGFDCASNNEISQVMSIGGIDPSRIIYANPCKANSSIRHARRLGVNKMTFDNADELDKIASLHPGAKLVIRMLVDDSKSLWALGDKFGASLPTIPSLLSKAKALDLDVIGVSFHVGCNCFDPSAYSSAIRNARAVFDMGKEAGYTFGLLDIGGGFVDASFEDAASALVNAINQYFPDRQGIEVIGEPGTYYVANAFSLAANIIARRVPLKGDEATGSPSGPIMCELSSSIRSISYNLPWFTNFRLYK